MSDAPQPPILDDDETPEPTAPKTEPMVSKSDAIVVLVLAVLGAAFWFWYHGEGNHSRSKFAHADSLYEERHLPQALAEYRVLRDSEKVISKLDDSLLYRRIDSLSTLEEHVHHMVEGSHAALISKDTNLERAALNALSADSSGFVPDSEVARLRAALGH